MMKNKPTRITQGGFSLLEVMIALAILATVLSAVVSNMATMQEVRRLNQEQQQMGSLATSFIQRLSTVSWQDVVDANGTFDADRFAVPERGVLKPQAASGWARARFRFDEDGKAQDGYTYDDLVTMGFLDDSLVTTGSNFDMFVEYYRQVGREVNIYKDGEVSGTETKKGLMDPGVEMKTADFKDYTKIKDYMLRSMGDLRYSDRLQTFTDDPQAPATYDPVIMRIVIRIDKQREFAYLTARSPKYEL